MTERKIEHFLQTDIPFFLGAYAEIRQLHVDLLALKGFSFKDERKFDCVSEDFHRNKLDKDIARSKGIKVKRLTHVLRSLMYII